MPARNEGRFIGPPERPIAAWLSVPSAGAGTVGAIVAPPIGYEYWTAHRSLRRIAERLAESGVLALRLDYDGTGDAAGEHLDGSRLVAWRQSLRYAADELRSLGCERLVGVGLRLGATLLAEEGASLGLEALVAWAPIDNGRRYAKQLSMFGIPAPPGADDGGVVSLQGVALSSATLDAIATLDGADLVDAPAPRVLLVERDDGPPSARLRGRLEELGVEVESATLPGTAEVIEETAERALVPEEIVERIGEFLGDGGEATRPLAGGRVTATLAWRGGEVVEEMVCLTSKRLVGIRTRPAGESQTKGLVVFLNSGSEHHVGPGRCWVEYSRSLALAGYETLRVDFTGWGESPDEGHAPGRPYARHLLDETRDLVTALRADGEKRIVLSGLCSGCYLALKLALDSQLEGIVAFNPYLAYEVGDPEDRNMDALAIRRAKERRRFKRLRRLGVWQLLDVLGLRHRAGRWLRALDRTGVPVLYLFAENDPGLEFLEDRIPRSWSLVQRRRGNDCVVVEGLDHPMYRYWLRPEVLAAMIEHLDAHVATPTACETTSRPQAERAKPVAALQPVGVLSEVARPLP